MKRIYYFVLLATLLLTATGTFAQSVEKPQSSELTGIWQICSSAVKNPDGTMNVRTGNSFKMLNADGSFTNIMFNMGEVQSIITATGTYKQTSDSTYVESINKSVNPTLNGKNNELRFHLKNGKLLHIKFYIEQYSNGSPLGRWLEEVWVKIEQPEKLTVDQSKVQL